MRETHDNSIDNALAKMFNVNRDYIDSEITRRVSKQVNSTDYRRNGILNFGASQMYHLTDQDNFLTVGSVITSPVVGP